MSTRSVPLRDLALQVRAPEEQILAGALELYAAIPAPARAATLRALRATAPDAQPALAREVVRAVVGVRLLQRQAAVIREANAGQDPEPEPFDLAADDALGAEVVARIRGSRERRAGLR